MDKIVISAAASATGEELPEARLGSRFGRMDLASQLALLAVEKLGVNFDAFQRERVGISLAAAAGSLTTDAEYWKGRDGAGGPSPTLFTYTLPSAAIGEIAIRHRLTGPNLCFVGNDRDVLPEAADMLQRGEAEGCVCVFVAAISTRLSEWIGRAPAARATAIFLQKGEAKLPDSFLLGEFDRDMESLCDKFCARKATK